MSEEIEMTDDNIYYQIKSDLEKQMSKLILNTLIAITQKQTPTYLLVYVIMAAKEIENNSFSSLSDTTIHILMNLAQNEIERISTPYDYRPIEDVINSLKTFIELCKKYLDKFPKDK